MREETRYPGEARFHYNREEREAGLSEYARNTLHAKGFFRRNRSLVITLIDVLVLLLLFFIINLYVRTRSKSELTDGLSVTSEGEIQDGRIFLSLTIKRTSDAGPTGVARVMFRALPDDVRVDVSDTLPEAKGETRVVHSVLEVSSSEPRVFATVDVGDSRKVFEVKLTNRSP